MISQERLEELFEYNAHTGAFTRKAKCRGARVGKVMGSKNQKGYLVLDIDGAKHRQHRLAWLFTYGYLPDGQIDHINHDKTDNRIENLRVVTNRENHKNMGKQSNNTSGITGVSWFSSRSKWVVRIKDGVKYRSLGYFDDIFEAACVRKSAENRLGYHVNHGV